MISSPSFLKGRKNFGCCTIFEAKLHLENKKKRGQVNQCTKNVLPYFLYPKEVLAFSYNHKTSLFKFLYKVLDWATVTYINIKNTIPSHKRWYIKLASLH